MRMVTIPNQSSVAKAYDEFDDAGRMKPSAYYDRIVDVMEELVRFTVLLPPILNNSPTAIPNGLSTSAR
jgi:arsenic resistance protein ArsH